MICARTTAFSRKREGNGSLDRCGNIEAFDSEPKAWFLSRGANRSEHFRCYFAMGKIRGTPRMRRHISVHRATTKYFSNSFVFKNEVEKKAGQLRIGQRFK